MQLASILLLATSLSNLVMATPSPKPYWQPDPNSKAYKKNSIVESNPCLRLEFHELKAVAGCVAHNATGFVEAAEVEASAPNVWKLFKERGKANDGFEEFESGLHHAVVDGKVPCVNIQGLDYKKVYKKAVEEKEEKWKARIKQEKEGKEREKRRKGKQGKEKEKRDKPWKGKGLGTNIINEQWTFKDKASMLGFCMINTLDKNAVFAEKGERDGINIYKYEGRMWEARWIPRFLDKLRQKVSTWNKPDHSSKSKIWKSTNKEKSESQTHLLDRRRHIKP
ncbi:hypothetical protein AMATHDRAFT_71052 [Amanita thiersii Skay4041]|uniref:Uncharacterized protein n=1 Tax=Amanita thiersii Skay4041 TaxID=703135 RepID=A0A2A9NC46_9AGAR|nr:hypothetical protein AMATHDRAFT_71052 [Amanita thiersii Skay4041]